jgi:5-formyltetrahydrofolate cyclo-ligase
VHEAGVDDQRTQREALRKSLRERRAALSSSEVRAASEAICATLGGLGALKRARVVALYAAVRGEIETAALHDLLRARGVRLAYPRIEADEPPRLGFHPIDEVSALQADRFEVAAPPAESPRLIPSALDVVIVPGVAFAPNGHRLGYGRGYYDAALAGCPRALRIGLCHEFQLVDGLPPHAGDQPVDLIVTPAALRPTGARPLYAPEEVLS